MFPTTSKPASSSCNPYITSLPALFTSASSSSVSGLEDDASTCAWIDGGTSVAVDDKAPGARINGGAVGVGIDGGTVGAAVDDDASGGIDDEASGPRKDGGTANTAIDGTGINDEASATRIDGGAIGAAIDDNASGAGIDGGATSAVMDDDTSGDGIDGTSRAEILDGAIGAGIGGATADNHLFKPWVTKHLKDTPWIRHYQTWWATSSLPVVLLLSLQFTAFCTSSTEYHQNYMHLVGRDHSFPRYDNQH
jgi:hypothetical protein